MEETIIEKRGPGRPRKIEDKLISITLKWNGEVYTTKVANILEVLRELPAKSNFLKTVVCLEVTYKNKTFFRVFKIPVFRMVLLNKTRQIFLAKLINQNLGITGENLYV